MTIRDLFGMGRRTKTVKALEIIGVRFEVPRGRGRMFRLKDFVNTLSKADHIEFYEGSLKFFKQEEIGFVYEKVDGKATPALPYPVVFKLWLPSNRIDGVSSRELERELPLYCTYDAQILMVLRDYKIGAVRQVLVDYMRELFESEGYGLEEEGDWLLVDEVFIEEGTSSKTEWRYSDERASTVRMPRTVLNSLLSEKEKTFEFLYMLSRLEQELLLDLIYFMKLYFKADGVKSQIVHRLKRVRTLCKELTRTRSLRFFKINGLYFKIRGMFIEIEDSIMDYASIREEQNGEKKSVLRQVSSRSHFLSKEFANSVFEDTSIGNLDDTNVRELLKELSETASAKHGLAMGNIFGIVFGSFLGFLFILVSEWLLHALGLL